MRPKRELVRVVRRPDGTVALDETGRLPGRGAYLCRDAACFDLAGRRHALARALGTAIPADIELRIAAGPDVLARPHGIDLASGPSERGAAAGPTGPLRVLDRPRPSIPHHTNIEGEAHG